MPVVSMTGPQLEIALHRLTPKTRQMLYLVVVRRVGYAEAAHILGISPSDGAQRLRTGMQALTSSCRPPVLA